MADVIGGRAGMDVVAEAAADALGEDVILQAVLNAAAATLPPIDRAGNRVAVMVDQARLYIRASVDLHAALAVVAPEAAKSILQKHAMKSPAEGR